MTPQQFDAALQGLMIQDSNGYYWMINRNTGRWQVSNGQTWVEANPYGSAPSVAVQRPPAKRPKAGIGCGKVFVFGCLAVVVLVAIAGVGGYVAYVSRSGPREVSRRFWHQRRRCGPGYLHAHP